MSASELRDFQQRASEAARPSEPVNLAAERQKREDTRGWFEECLASERKFGGRAARLFPMIGVPGGVMTPSGQGTLFNARSDGCQVVLTRGRKTGRRQSGERYRPLREFPVEAIKPYGGNAR